MNIITSSKWINAVPGAETGKSLNEFFKLDDIYIRSVISNAGKSLNNSGAREGIIGISSSNPLLGVLWTISIWKSGLTPAVLDPGLPAAEMLRRCRECNIKFILTDTLPSRKPGSLKILSPGLTEELTAIEPGKRAGGVVLFTSGSTGKPKAVNLDSRAVRAAFRMADKLFSYKSTENSLLSLPFHHVGGFSIFVRAFLAGQTLVIPEGSNYLQLRRCLQTVPADYISLVPAQLRKMISLPSNPLQSVKAVLTGGGASERKLIEKSIRKKINICKVYGSTETFAFFSAISGNELAGNPEAAGVPLKGVRIKILDERGNSLPAGEPGQIAVKSPSLAQGYLNDKKSGKAKFKDGFYLTGDRGMTDSGGCIYIQSRIDGIINSGGKKINPSEVETKLNAIKGIRESAVLGVKDKLWGEMVVAAIQLYRNSNLTAHKVKKLLLRSLLPYQIPKVYYIVEDFPGSTPGKRDKTSLMKLIAGRRVRTLS